MRAMLRRWVGRMAPVLPADVSPLDRLDGLADPRSLCMVQACGEAWTDDRHGWRTCSVHAPVSVR